MAFCFFNILSNVGDVEGREAWYWQPCHPICPPHGQAIPPAAELGQGKRIWWGNGSDNRCIKPITSHGTKGREGHSVYIRTER